MRPPIARPRCRPPNGCGIAVVFAFAGHDVAVVDSSSVDADALPGLPQAHDEMGGTLKCWGG